MRSCSIILAKVVILIETREKQGKFAGAQAIALFGVGLIGRSVLFAIGKDVKRVVRYPFSWTLEHRQATDLETIKQHVLSVCDETATPPISHFDIVWAAGQTGFSSQEDQIVPEVSAFERVLSLSLQLLHHVPGARHSFHLISSAGGLFEGQKHIDRNSIPRPLRPYGHSKLLQERLLSRLPTQVRKMVYRLSSVYGFSGTGTRSGLVNTLIRNSIRHQSSNIFGNAHTIRDYVLVSDVGKFVVSRLQDIDPNSYVLTLASGKPTAIFEMLNRIEKIVGRKLPYTFDSVRTNASDMSFSPAILPEYWFPTDFDTGLRQTVRSLKASTLRSTRAAT